MRALVLGLVVAACGAPAVTSAPVEAAHALPERIEEALARPCSLEATYPFLTEDEKQALIDAFTARTGRRWDISPEQQYGGHITRASRVDAAKNTSVNVDLEAVGRAFFTRNAAAIGLVPEDLERAKYSDDIRGSLLTFDGPVPGLEAYVPPPQRSIRLVYSVVEGEVYGFESSGSTVPREHDLCPEPPNPPVLDNVIGRELFFVPTGPNMVVTSVGTVDAASITKREPTLVETSDAHALHYTVAWRLKVERGGYSWWFTVSAADGTVLAG